MKKLLLTIAAFGYFALNAQVEKKMVNTEKGMPDATTTTTKNDNTKRDAPSGWFQYMGAYNTFNGSGLGGSVFFIQPDTNLITVFDDGQTNNTGFHQLGKVNDAKSEVFDGNPGRFTRFTSYTWDSLAFLKFYIRQIDSMKVGNSMVEVVDTCEIQYFDAAGLSVQAFTYNSAPTVTHYYAVPNRDNYNKNTLRNSSAFKTETILLRKADADSMNLNGANTNFSGSALQVPVGRTISTNGNSVTANIVAHTITFKPMKKGVLGDTMVAYNGTNWTNKYNMFGLRYSSKTGLTHDQTDQSDINNSIINNFQVRYGQTFSIFKSYLPGTIWTNTLFDNSFYHLTASNDVDVTSQDFNGNALGYVYPNPSTGSSSVFAPVKLTSDVTVTINVMDITGKVVKTIVKDATAGDQDIEISTEGLSNGIYTLSISSDIFSATTKFVLN